MYIILKLLNNFLIFYISGGSIFPGTSYRVNKTNWITGTVLPNYLSRSFCCSRGITRPFDRGWQTLLARLAGIAATIRCKCRVQGGRASTERFPLSGRPNLQETTTAARRRNPLAASQPSGLPPLVAAVATPECIPTASAIIDREGGIRVSPRDRQTGGGVCWWNYFVRQKTSPLLSLSLPPFLYLCFLTRKDGKWRGRRVENARGRCTESMKVATAKQINQNSWLSGLVRIFRRGWLDGEDMTLAMYKITWGCGLTEEMPDTWDDKIVVK